MPARSGAEYVESIKKHAPCVYLGGRRIADVTAEPLFVEPIRAIAEQYDMQCDAAYREVMTYPSPSTGQPGSAAGRLRSGASAASVRHRPSIRIHIPDLGRCGTSLRHSVPSSQRIVSDGRRRSALRAGRRSRR